MTVDCLTCRESLSARLDGEAETARAEQVDAHLVECGACQVWLRRAEDLNRLLRVRPAVPVPDLTQTILTDAPVIEPGQGWGVRGALVCVAVAQIALGLSQLVGVGTTAMHVTHIDSPPVAGHLFNESTAWNLALGIGMLWAAFRPRATTGLVPMLTGFLVVLLAYSAHDLLTGAVPVSRVLGHGLLLVGLILMIIVNRRHRPRTPESAKATQPGIDHTDGDAGSTDVATPTGRPHLRPASHHRAA